MKTQASTNHRANIITSPLNITMGDRSKGARCFWIESTEEQDEALKRLLQAAPELLEACTNLARVVESILDDYTSKTADFQGTEKDTLDRSRFYAGEIAKSSAELDELFPKVQAVIAKATATKS